MKISSFCFLVFSCLVLTCNLQAQDNILESLKTSRAGQGTVTVHQDSRISDLVGNRTVTNSSSSSTNPSTTTPSYPGTGSSEGSTMGRRSFKTNGYRLQVYAGNNSRQAKEEAYRKASLVREYLPGVPVYTYFASPRWLCRVGDFRSVEEADAAMRRLRATPHFKEVTMVREQINVHY